MYLGRIWIANYCSGSLRERALTRAFAGLCMCTYGEYIHTYTAIDTPLMAVPPTIVTVWHMVRPSHGSPALSPSPSASPSHRKVGR